MTGRESRSMIRQWWTDPHLFHHLLQPEDVHSVIGKNLCSWPTAVALFYQAWFEPLYHLSGPQTAALYFGNTTYDVPPSYTLVVLGSAKGKTIPNSKPSYITKTVPAIGALYLIIYSNVHKACCSSACATRRAYDEPPEPELRTSSCRKA